MGCQLESWISRESWWTWVHLDLCRPKAPRCFDRDLSRRALRTRLESDCSFWLRIEMRSVLARKLLPHHVAVVFLRTRLLRF